MSTDRVVLVTGGNRGIGRAEAIAERFVAEGYRVAVTARSGEGPRGHADGPRGRDGCRRPRRRIHRGGGDTGSGGDRRGQRGHHEGHTAAAHDRGRLRQCDRHEPRRHLPCGQAGVEGDAARSVGARHPHLERRRPVRLGRTDQLRRLQERARGVRALTHPRAGSTRHHRERHRPRVHRDGHDLGAARGHPGRIQEHPRRAIRDDRRGRRRRDVDRLG